MSTPSIPEQIRAARGDRSQGDVASAASLRGQQTVSEIESGRADPKLSTLQKLATALGVPLVIHPEPAPTKRRAG